MHALSLLLGAGAGVALVLGAQVAVRELRLARRAARPWTADVEALLQQMHRVRRAERAAAERLARKRAAAALPAAPSPVALGDLLTDLDRLRTRVLAGDPTLRRRASAPEVH